MDYAVFTKVMIRAAGFLTIMFAVGAIPAAILALTVTYNHGPAPETILVVLGSLSLPLLLGAALFLSANRITNRSFPPRSTPPAQPVDARGFESAALFVLAWYVLVYAVPDAVQVLFYLVMHGFGAGVMPVVMEAQYARLAGVLPKVIIALGLIVYSRRLISPKGASRA
jgi:hypothetical protein